MNQSKNLKNNTIDSYQGRNSAVLICPICKCQRCDAKSVKGLGSFPAFVYFVCEDCRHGFIEPSEYARVYDVQLETSSKHSLMPKAKSARWPHRQNLVARSIERQAGAEGSILDVGCSNGLALAAFSPGWKKFGVELNPATAEVARVFARADVFCGPIEEYSPHSGGFDVITAFALVEHLKDPAQFVRSLRTWLRPAGLLVVMTGDRESQVARKMQDAWPLFHSPDHLHFFCANSVRRLLQNEGFVIEKEEWRYMYDAVPRGRTFRNVQKALEILGFNDSPMHDHYYCFGRAAK